MSEGEINNLISIGTVYDFLKFEWYFLPSWCLEIDSDHQVMDSVVHKELSDMCLSSAPFFCSTVFRGLVSFIEEDTYNKINNLLIPWL